jgi:hypothetical protein
MPADGYRVERADEGHVLFSFDRDARTVADVVAADHVTDWNGHRGWGVEAWATCDPAELGDGDVDDGVEVWTGEAGRRIPTSTVKSFQGSEHCDWQDITFLWLGAGSESDRDYDEYLRDPAGELADFTVTSYDGAAALPDDARSTGWRHDGRELWVARHPRAAYLVSVDDPDDVERWPATKRPISCA